ncbi:MAG TPA: PilZ domain-containing protein [Candidatus Limnocylindrales bacterium]|jgi:hypothetical protein|nr:PilZ domain-containing protein [Candidatus Limnocylindrales bacterium]
MIFSAPAKQKQRERRHPRTKLRKILLVAWEGGGRRDASRARNLCPGGIYIDTTDPADINDNVELLFDTPRGEIRARAIVRSTHMGRGMGVEFTGLDSLARRRLHNLLEDLLVTDEPADRVPFA